MTTTEGSAAPAAGPASTAPASTAPAPTAPAPTAPAPTAPASTAAAPAAPPSATADGGIDRLNAFDGLFLRAEHLTRIQDYARELALAVGAAAGPGVAEGYEVSVRAGVLRVGAGLAVSAEGRPLRSDRLVTLPLAGLVPGPDGFWWVEAVPAAREYGEAPVQGVSCDDPCSGTAATRHPYTAEGVRIRLTEDRERGLDAQLPAARRNYLASRIFRAERTEHSAWPYGTAGGGAGTGTGPGGAPALPADWDPPPAAPSRSQAVRLAVLLRVPGTAETFEADTWTARRDRGAPPPDRYWQSRLGMRPRDVFTAQILQFQTQLAQVLAAQEAPRTDLGPLLEQLALLGGPQFLKSHTKDQLGREVARIVAGLAEGAPTAPAAPRGPYSIAELGLVELPPAGYLPLPPAAPPEDPPEDRDGPQPEDRDGPRDAQGGPWDRVRTLLGPHVDLAYCRAGLADVADAVEEARNRDRIRLDRPDAVDVLLPVDEAGEQAADWVAFVRSRRRSCHSPGSTARGRTDTPGADREG
ncbi:hypothetical protein AB0953_20255 [Streptomyces sp. NPDC046866]|uniref:hypothetical protein n=1 Tax=Streptomyces sp. NPDC046866 TaxID=3154921 RepID=UPI0034540F2E